MIQAESDDAKHPLLQTASTSSGRWSGVKKRGKLPRLLNNVCRDWVPCVPARFVMAAMSALGLGSVFLLRVNLSVAIVQMNKNTATLTNRTAKVFDWSSSEQGWLLSSFFIGYILTQLPGGWLAQKYGGKWLFGVGVLGTSVFTLLTPVAAYLSVWALVVLRVLEGVVEGVTLPAVSAIWGRWAPPPERSRLIAFTYIGGHLGSFVGFLLSGLLCEYGFAGGWPSVFYVFGGLGIVWFFFWTFLGYSSPSTHPRISKEEREYIECSIGDKKEEVPIPWLEILTSGPFWAITVGHFGFCWGLYSSITCLPTYFNQALGLRFAKSIVLNGVYSALPYGVLAFTFVFSGFVSDFTIMRSVPVIFVRKLFTSIGLMGSALFLLICAYLGNSIPTGVVFMTISVGILGFSLTGLGPNLLDIAPRFSGILMALINTIGTLAGIIAPKIAKAIAVPPLYITNSPSYVSEYKEEWREMFVLGAEILLFTALVYLILGSGKKQPWANGSTSYRKKHQYTDA